MPESQWKVEQIVATARGEVPLDQVTAEERQHLVENVFVAFIRAKTPEGVQVRLAREGRRPAVGE